MGWLITAVIILGLAVSGRYCLIRWYTAPLQLQAAYTSWAQGQHEQAEQSAWQAYQLAPTLTEAALLAAEIAAERQRYQPAIEYARHVTGSEVEPEARLKAYLLLAHIYHRRTFQLGEAETCYRLALSLRPDDIEAQTGLANLLGLCGRRAEAIPLILNLVRLGSPSDLLMLLSREDTVVNDPRLLEQARAAAPQDPLPLLGQAWHVADQGDHTQAIALLRQALQHNSQLEAARVLVLKYLAASGQMEHLRSELMQLDSMRTQMETWSDYWLACGQLSEHENRALEAIRCYGEAMLRAPDAKKAVARLASLLYQQGEPATAKVFETYSQDLQTLRDAQEQVFFANAPPDARRIENMVRAYVKVGRLWEALGWCRAAGESNPALRAQLAVQLTELEKQTASQPLNLVPPEVSPCRQLNLARYPLPVWTAQRTPAEQVRPDKSVDPPTKDLAASSVSFRDDAPVAGLDFQYVNGVQGVPQRRMYEFPGGGIAVIDFDRDGRPDLALAQGCLWPPSADQLDHRDSLLRNVDGQRFQPATVQALAPTPTSDGFGQGISQGDVNSDGFPDLYIAQIGQNRLLINMGDGTFEEETSWAAINDTQWTTSCLIADLTSDGLPDLYDVNYVQGDDVFERVCTDASGQPAMCMPGDFDAAMDKLWINQGDGTFIDGTSRLLTPPSGKGLGCLAFMQPGTSGLSLLVANDTTPNFLYTPGPGSDGQPTWHESGVPSGVAFSANGKAQGCMGIAADDINGDGQPDFVITNFLNESSVFYSSQAHGGYSDETLAAGLIEPTRNVLGFGTQFLDVDNNGTSELFMANGHIDDLRRRDVPYAMPPQIFQHQRGRFQLMAPEPLGEYFQKQWIGRSAARLDWNQDGRLDLVVGHLNAPYALLTNTTADPGRWISIELVGTKSNRDAIGAQVSVLVGQKRQHAQLMAGDGYMASNQRLLHFGLGTSDQAERIEIAWPSGQSQTLQAVTAGSRLLVVEPLVQ